MRTKYSLTEVWDGLMYFSILLFLLYSLWFQQVSTSLGGALSVFGIVFLALIALKIYHVNFYAELNLFIAFSIVISLETFLFAYYRDVSMNMLLTHYKYVIPLIAIYTYISGSERKLQKVLWAVTISIDLLCIASFVSPVISKTGAVSVGTLNVNVFSSFLMLGLLCELTLFLNRDITKIGKSILALSGLLAFVVQINTASRRGFLVFCFILAFVIWQSVRLEFRGKPVVKILFMVMLVIGALLAFVSFVDQFGDTALMTRLIGGSNDTSEGDRMRSVFQAAAWRLFQNDPITGAGLNSVSVVAGMYSHSFYFELLGCTGIAGFILVMGYLSRSLFLFNGYMNEAVEAGDKNAMYLSLCGETLILAVLICGYAVVMIYDMYFYIIIALIAALRMVLKNLSYRRGYGE